MANLAGFACIFAASPASAAEPCALVTVVGALHGAWLARIDSLRAEIARVPASQCQSMAIAITPIGTAVRVTATTGDGRHAERIVEAPAALEATALGLLFTIPPGPTPMPSVPRVEPAPVEAVGTQSARGDRPGAVDSPRSTSAPELWTGLAAGMRLTAPTGLVALDLEARGDLLLQRWLLFATVRSAPASCQENQGQDCNVYSDASAGVGFGRRFRGHGSAVDLALEPSYVAMHMEYDGPRGESESVQGHHAALRVDGSARLAVPIAASWLLTVTAEGGVSPTLLASPARLPSVAPGISTPPFPAWSGGVRLGAAGEVL